LFLSAHSSREGELSWSKLDQKDVLTIHHHLVTLVQDLANLDDPSKAFALGIFFLLLDGDPGMQRVPDENGFGNRSLS
jgi:hypothetical protein